MFAWLFAIVGTAGSITSSMLLSGPQGDLGILLAIIGPIVFVLGGLMIGSTARVLTPTKIEGDYAWLKGACPEFLDRFPSA